MPWATQQSSPIWLSNAAASVQLGEINNFKPGENLDGGGGGGFANEAHSGVDLCYHELYVLVNVKDPSLSHLAHPKKKKRGKGNAGGPAASQHTYICIGTYMALSTAQSAMFSFFAQKKKIK